MTGAVVEMIRAGTYEVRHPACGTRAICDAERSHVACTCGELTVDFNGGVPHVSLASAAVA